MAHMIPSEIGSFDKRSGENEMFQALSRLSNDYYVFHSYRVRQVINGGLNDSEADFLVFNPSYGCLFIEAKNGHVQRTPEGDWLYSSGLPMKDPFDQACASMYAVLTKFRETYHETKWEHMINNCKFLYCVWFPAYTKNDIEASNFGPNVEKKLILTREALTDPTGPIETIMQEIQKMHVVVKMSEIIEDGKNYKHNLTKEQSIDFLKNVLCPSFDIVEGMKKKYMMDNYSKLLEEQCVVLDFLANQKSAAINGASGTGKTFVALERAARLARKGEKVLFLCYNKNLKEHLENNNKIEGIDFYTIDGLACKKTSSSIANYSKLKQVLEYEFLNDTFEYQHIIVDEGQDFGRDSIEESNVLDLLADYGNSGEGKSFFIFYDKNQLVNCKQLPTYLQDVDSKITLYKNCRNTKKIADSAYSLINARPEVYDGAFDGEEPQFIFYNDTDELQKRINNIVEKVIAEKEFGIVLITCRGLEKNSLYPFYDSKTGNYKTLSKRSVKLYTSATFKGLEEDYVLLFDVDRNCFEEDNLTYYVGASRARKKLYIFISMSDEEANMALQKRFPNAFPKKDKKQQLALAMHGKYIK